MRHEIKTIKFACDHCHTTAVVFDEKDRQWWDQHIPLPTDWHTHSLRVNAVHTFTYELCLDCYKQRDQFIPAEKKRLSLALDLLEEAHKAKMLCKQCQSPDLAFEDYTSDGKVFCCLDCGTLQGPK